jgi:McrBC 5-methylcytosine restriction system component
VISILDLSEGPAVREVAPGESLMINVGLKSLSEMQKKSLIELFKVTDAGDRLILQARLHRTGTAVIRQVSIRVRSPVSSRILVGILGYASGLDIEKFVIRDPTLIGQGNKWNEELRTLLAFLMARAAEAIVGRHVSQAYIRQSQRLTTIRGTPEWIADFGAGPGSGRSCRYFEKSTDNLLNRLVLAGLAAAVRSAQNSHLVAVAVARQSFIWQGLTREQPVSLVDFEVGERSLDRLTQHYATALVLARVLCFGLTPDDPFTEGAVPMQSFFVDLAVLFERFTARLVDEYSSTKGLGVRAQFTQQHSLVDGKGADYRNIRPDIILYGNHKPIAVIDAKFKSGYVEADSNGVPQKLVSSADIYQMYFYKLRLMHRFRIDADLPSAIVAPVVLEEARRSARSRRIIRWQSDSSGHSMEIQVLPLPLVAVVESLMRGEGSLSALCFAPELSSFIDGALARWRALAA